MPDSVIKYSDLIGEDDTFKVIFENIEQLKKELLELTKVTQKQLSLVNPNEEKKIEELTKQIDQLVKQKKELDKQEKTAVKTRKKLQDLTEDELIQREKQKIINRERVQRAKQLAILRNQETGQIEKLRAQLSLTTLQWKKLSKEELDNGKKGAALIATKKRLTDELKRLEKQTGDTRRNVGNYGDALGRVGKLAARVFVGRSLFDGLRRIGSGFATLIEKNKETNAEIGNLDKALGDFGTSFSNLGLSILSFVAKPLTLLINGVTSLINVFSSPTFKEFSATSDELKNKTAQLSEEFTKEKVAAETLFIGLKKANEGSKERKNAIEQINKQYGKYLPNLLTEQATLQDIEKAQNLVNQALSKNFLLKTQQATLEDVVTNKINAQKKAFEDLQKSLSILDKDVDLNLNAFNTLVEVLGDSEGVGRLASRALNGYRFEVSKFTDEIRKSDPQLADFIENIRAVGGDASDILIEQIQKAQRETNKYNDVINETQSSISDISESIDIFSRETDKSSKSTSDSTKKIKDNTDAIEKNKDARLKAIEALQAQLDKAEVENIEDAQEKALRLEELRFKTQEKAREESIQKIVKLQEKQEQLIIEQYGKDSQKLKDFIEQRNKEIEQINGTAFDIELQALEKHEQNKIDIRKKFGVKAIKIQTITLQDTIDDLQEKEIKKVNETEELKSKIIRRNQKKTAEERKKDLEELTDAIIESSKKIGEAIVSNFEKQSELAASLVEQQAEAVETQRERAEQGLTNTLKFEQEQLAKREADRIRAEQNAKNAAKILTLFNLVSAYAQSGDTNALQRGLVDFGLLTALESALQGFETGGYTGSDARNDTVKGVVHANEFVLTAEQTKKYGLTNKSAGEFGEAMSDYFNQQSPLLNDTYKQQNERFKSQLNVSKFTDFSTLEAEVRAMRQTLQNQPKNDFDVERMTDYFVDIAKRVTKNRMTTITKARKRL